MKKKVTCDIKHDHNRLNHHFAFYFIQKDKPYFNNYETDKHLKNIVE